MSKMKLNKHTVEITHPDKVLFPDIELTKYELAEYYEKISDYILPHIKDRPVTMHRYPNGINKKSFYQKDASDFFPAWIKTIKINKKEGGSMDAPVCNDKAALVYLANLASITPHIWLSKIDNLNKPDKVIFDLDPSKDNFEDVKFAAKALKNFFEDELDITPFLMTTGSRGIHVVIPIKPKNDFDTVRTVTQKIAGIVAGEHKDKLTTETRKQKREGRIYLDVARNAFGQTAVAPYSVRARKNAPVATPIDWKELNKINNAQVYTVKNIFKRLSTKKDPWKDINRNRFSFERIKMITGN